jgi:hypothetical protein
LCAAVSFAFLQKTDTASAPDKYLGTTLCCSVMHCDCATRAPKAFTYGGGTYNLTITPAKIVATTPYVTITGTINNFLNTAGCNIGIKGTYVKEP